MHRMKERVIPEFGTIERVNFDVSQIVAFILGEDRPFKYVIPKQFVAVVIPFLDYEFEGPTYYKETIVFLAYWKLKDFARMEQFLDDLMKEMDEDFEPDEIPLGKNLVAK
jgi:hypothetical protein